MKFVTSISALLTLLLNNGRIDQKTFDQVTEYVAKNKVEEITRGEF